MQLNNENGKIICINKSIHKVLLSNNTIVNCFTRGKLRKEGIVPVVGDNCIVNTSTTTIESIEKRKNFLDRPLIANIDKLLIVMSTSIPSFSSYLIDKFLVIAYSNNIEPIIVITKTDMITLKEKKDIRKYVQYYKKIGIKVYYNKNIKSLKKEFKNSCVALTGQTGAGKSTLLNKIDASLDLKTGEVSDALGRGKHTTRLVELLEINGGLIADTPGFSSLSLNVKRENIRRFYKDYNEKCEYRSCIHKNEEGCKIKELVKKKKIPSWRYDNYLKLLEEAK